MEEGKAHQNLQADSWFRHLRNKDDQWLKVDDSSHENSLVSNGSSVYLSSCDTADDDASSNSSGSLYDLSELMVQLPIKRGLSKFYQGRSESFTSLSRVTSVEDLAKKTTTPFKRKRKSCDYKPYIRSPKPIISKTKKSRPSHKKMQEELC